MFDLLDRPTEPEPNVRMSIPNENWGMINSRALISALRRSNSPLSIYVHIVSKWDRVSPAYIENLIAEMDLLEVANGRSVNLFIWGVITYYLDSL
jgi:hypothetical protein